jgi:SOS-response transcriptional repressor LexA
MNNIPMTPVMLKLLNFIKKYVKKNKYYPTYQEMADALNYKSKNSITVLVNRLAKRNELKKN